MSWPSSLSQHQDTRTKRQPMHWLAVFAYLVFASVSLGAPTWWSTRGVLTTNAPNDFAAVNAGQAKHMARRAFDEMQAVLRGGAGATLSNAVFALTTSNAYAPVTVGQLKELARPFYDRLVALNFATGYPWSATTTDDADRAMANIGQLKQLFSFDFADSDGDGLSDAEELSIYGTNPALADTDSDGLSDGLEVLLGLNPLSTDTDGDGLSDGVEYANGGEPGSRAVATISQPRAGEGQP